MGCLGPGADPRGDDGSISRFGSIDDDGRRHAHTATRRAWRSAGKGRTARNGARGRTASTTTSTSTPTSPSSWSTRPTATGSSSAMIAGSMARSAPTSVPRSYGSVRGNLAIGASLRGDAAEVALFDQVARTRLDTRIANSIPQQNASVWARQNLAVRATGDPAARACGAISFTSRSSPRPVLPAGRRATGQRHEHARTGEPEGEPHRRGGTLHDALCQLRASDFTRTMRATWCTALEPGRRCLPAPSVPSSGCASHGRAAAWPWPRGCSAWRASWPSWVMKASPS